MDHEDAPGTLQNASADGSADPAIATLGRAAGLALGVVAAVLAAVGEGLRRFGSEARTGSVEEVAEDQVVDSAELIDSVGHAVVGVGTAVAQVTVAMAFAGFRGFERAATAVLRQPVVRAPVDRMTAATAAWEERGREALDVDAQAAVDAGLDLAAEIAARVIGRLDLDPVIDRIDLDRVVARIDLDEIAGRLDVNAIAARLDLDRLIGRLDLARIAQGVIDELDLAAVAEGVIDELELSEIIRESTGTVTVDAVDAIRVGGMNADRLVSRIVDRVLMRRNGTRPDPASPPSHPPAP